ncbi:MAG: GyrI-like domain-containing protein [Chitinispirillales bacterium]|nr:GyrI-like domain-containing protein [Chitinispirillales bacterium]
MQLEKEVIIVEQISNNQKEMKFMKVFLIILAILVVLFIIIYAYYGGFKKISFKIENQGGEFVVYENLTGDYSQSPKISDRVYYTLLNDEKIATTKGIGIYYDNPKKVAKEKLRSEIGCIVENADSTTLTGLAEKYKVKTLHQNEFVVAEFPFKGKLSVLFGIMKVYPALDKFCKEQGYAESPITEIYDVPNKKIIYRKETKKE